VSAYIGIISRVLRTSPVESPGQGVRQPFLDSILAAGGIPVVIPLLEDLQALRKLYNLCAGIVITGGEDLDPQRYGESPIPEMGEVCALRDEVEIQSTRWCVDEKKPLLGVCRGIQLMNVALGGSLYQDLKAQFCPDNYHYAPVDGRWDTLMHSISIEPGSRLFTLMNTSQCTVNSNHHQAARKIAPSFTVSARSEDGIVEGMELPDHPFCVAVQCHPEYLWQKVEPQWLELFRGLARAAADFARTGTV